MLGLLLALLLWPTATLSISFGGPLLIGEKQILSDICEQSNIAQLPSLFPGWCVPGSNPCADWFSSFSSPSIICDGAVVSSLFMQGDRTQPIGVLPQSISQFSAIQFFTILATNIGGTLNPAFFTDQAFLVAIRIIASPVEGTLPRAFNPLLANAVVEIVIGDTEISGTLPPEFAQLTTLRGLGLSRNRLEGTLPSEWATMSNLRNLQVDYNKLEGGIPEEYCTMPSLNNLNLRGNRLSLAPECTELLNPAMDECDLRENLFCESELNRSKLGPCVVDARLPGKVDRCDVCGGNGKSCIDCAGVVRGTSVVDACGVCGGPTVLPEDCPDCAGVPGGDFSYDACGLCVAPDDPGRDTACADCTGLAFGSAAYDACDVCNGDASTCTDCSGLLFGTLEYDACDVCGGDSSSCADCAGVPNGGQVLDVCNVCGGSGDSCTDCFGTPFGTLEYDRCDVCGGDGTLCGIGAINAQVVSGSAIPMLAFIGLPLAALLCGCGLFALVSRERRAAVRQIYVEEGTFGGGGGGGGIPRQPRRRPVATVERSALIGRKAK